ncbi:hypothetical protein HAHE_32510 [Haloferula helveola]|uniref:TonB C-terminal domain-containing protein n=1 Tax=Haloferula helveola TaxID=490095 RepID=A0ABM7RGE3_9BACT|nr:hypothetical protein HAHE_32510 [Haloferula helveola]
MQAVQTIDRVSDARLWLVAVLVSVAVNGTVVLVLAFLALHSLIFTIPEPEQGEQAAEERVMTILPMVAAEPPPPPVEKPMGFARTSEDQPSGLPENPKFIGERDTLATSDAAAVADAPDMPSQTGIEPRVPDEIETTTSEYQDGSLDQADPAGAPAEPTEMAVETPPADPADPVSPPPSEVEAPEEGIPGVPKERLADGPLPVDRPVPPEMVEEEPKSAPETARTEEGERKEEAVEEQPKEVKNQPGSDPGFRGYQRKTELKGSISRSGRSALDVKSGPLGKYHAALSRAIEQSWQRQVVRNRDFITPGVIRIRVVLDENGRVRTVGTVEEFGVGTIQIGFTHAAIREADLPKMPADVKKELDGEPLELLYNFIF